MSEALSKQEWTMMETLWNNSPLFLSQIMEEMSDQGRLEQFKLSDLSKTNDG